METVQDLVTDKQVAVCSGCDNKKSTVDRLMFDGLCADCTDRALYDYEFQKKAKKTNRKLIEHGK